MTWEFSLGMPGGPGPEQVAHSIGRGEEWRSGVWTGQRSRKGWYNPDLCITESPVTSSWAFKRSRRNAALRQTPRGNMDATLCQSVVSIWPMVSRHPTRLTYGRLNSRNSRAQGEQDSLQHTHSPPQGTSCCIAATTYRGPPPLHWACGGV
jgi:hypothetical protein